MVGFIVVGFLNAIRVSYIKLVKPEEEIGQQSLFSLHKERMQLLAALIVIIFLLITHLVSLM